MSILAPKLSKELEVIKRADDISALVQGWKDEGLRVAFVPTMGALHEGHLSLMRLGLEHADRLVVSIFVNPTQFAPHEDFESYPRDVGADALMIEELGVQALYLPNEIEIYPDGDISSGVATGAAAEGLESDFRPHFFGGVVNVVSRLLLHVQPDIAVFGEKDYQQLCVVREMVEALDMGIEIIGGEIVRGEGGLALSSRNAYLSAKEMQVARQLNVILRSKHPTPEELLEVGFDKVDYVSERWGRVLAAAWVGSTRLIDNIDLR